MIRGLFRLVLVVVLLVGLGAFFLGYRWADFSGPATDRPSATSGIIDADDKARAREAGAEIGETVAEGADQAKRAAADGSITAKIKAKMALDDSVKAANIDIDTRGSTVTLTGNVSSAAERERALRLARETDGVSSVVDHLVVAK
jgi:hyperosmotically inducible protein